MTPCYIILLKIQRKHNNGITLLLAVGKTIINVYAIIVFIVNNNITQRPQDNLLQCDVGHRYSEIRSIFLYNIIIYVYNCVYKCMII